METMDWPVDVNIKEEIEVEVGIDLGEDEYYEDFTQCNVHEECVDRAEANEDEQNYEMIFEAKKLEKLIINLQNLEEDAADYFQCHECSFETSDKNDYLNHLDDHNKESHSLNRVENIGSKHFQCPKCSFKSCIGQKLLDHLKDHEKVEMKCPNCPYETTNDFLLFQHQKLMHPEAKEYICVKCNYKTTIKENFTSHLECHVDTSKYFSCNKCDYKTDRKWNLSQHGLIHNDKNLRKFYCSDCSYVGYNKASFLKHLKKHKNGDPLHCPYCSYETYEKGALSQHALTHKVEKRFQCPYCEYKAHRNWSLNLHIKNRHMELHFLDNEETIEVPEEEVIHIIA